MTGAKESLTRALIGHTSPVQDLFCLRASVRALLAPTFFLPGMWFQMRRGRARAIPLRHRWCQGGPSGASSRRARSFRRVGATPRAASVASPRWPRRRSRRAGRRHRTSRRRPSRSPAGGHPRRCRGGAGKRGGSPRAPVPSGLPEGTTGASDFGDTSRNVTSLTSLGLCARSQHTSSTDAMLASGCDCAHRVIAPLFRSCRRNEHVLSGLPRCVERRN